MTLDRFVAALRARPFRPFVVKMDDGQTYQVPGPAQVIILPDRRHVAVAPNDRDDVVTLDIQQAVSLEMS